MRGASCGIGDDHGDLDDAVALGRQAGHLEVDPDQVLVALGERQRGSVVGHGGSACGSMPRHSGSAYTCGRCSRTSDLAVRRRAASPRWRSKLWLADAPDAPRRAAPRRGAGRVRRHASRSQAHQKAADYTLAKAPLRPADHGVRRRRAARLDAARRARRAQRRRCATRSQPRWGDLAYQLALLAAFALIGGLLDLPFELLPHLPHRAALRLQPHDLAPVRSPTSLKGLRSAPRSACRSPRWCCGSWAPPARCGGCGPGARGSAFNLLMLVIVPDLDRAAVQQVRAAAPTSR